MAPRESWVADTGPACIGLHTPAEWRARGGREPSPTESRMVVERHGHTVVVSHDGLTIDGQRVSSRPPTPAEAKWAGDPYTSPAFQTTDSGAVVYHGRIVAHLRPDRPPVLYGAAAPAWARGAGHTVVVDPRGLYIDGVQVAEHPMPAPVDSDNCPLRIAKDGRVFYSGRLIAELTPNPRDPAAPPRLRLNGGPSRAAGPERQLSKHELDITA
ncbi:hypothetical protein [Streptomyces sp. NPDC051162]|uniref:hypothetical protein n=1 Tax=Streptomyces sp. NPDC051162 TaxID=3154747 RepID=UPI0034311DB0